MTLKFLATINTLLFDKHYLLLFMTTPGTIGCVNALRICSLSRPCGLSLVSFCAYFSLIWCYFVQMEGEGSFYVSTSPHQVNITMMKFAQFLALNTRILVNITI